MPGIHSDPLALQPTEQPPAPPGRGRPSQPVTGSGRFGWPTRTRRIQTLRSFDDHSGTRRRVVVGEQGPHPSGYPSPLASLE
jgi:hypothetical protein